MQSQNNNHHRRHERHHVEIPLVFRDAIELKREYTENISRSGLFVKTDRHLQAGDVVTVTIELPGSDERFEVDGTIEYHQKADPKHVEGYGIQFVAISPTGWKSLEDYLTRLEQPA